MRFKEPLYPHLMADSLCAAQRAWRAANQQAAHSCLWPGCLQPIIPFPPVAICDIPFLSAETFWELGNWTHCSAMCSHLGAQGQRPQCLMANGRKWARPSVTSSGSHGTSCNHREPQGQPCNIRGCPPRCVQSLFFSCHQGFACFKMHSYLGWMTQPLRFVLCGLYLVLS